MIYLDTSVLVSLLVAEPASPSVRHWFERSCGEDLATSDWAVVEFGSAMSIKVRQKGLSTRLAVEARGELHSMIDDAVDLHTPMTEAFSHAQDLVAQHQTGLRGGDALHLAVAIEIGAGQFVTLDKKLVKAAHDLRLPIEVMTPA